MTGAVLLIVILVLVFVGAVIEECANHREPKPTHKPGERFMSSIIRTDQTE